MKQKKFWTNRLKIPNLVKYSDQKQQNPSSINKHRKPHLEWMSQKVQNNPLKKSSPTLNQSKVEQWQNQFFHASGIYKDLTVSRTLLEERKRQKSFGKRALWLFPHLLPLSTPRRQQSEQAGAASFLVQRAGIQKSNMELCSLNTVLLHFWPVCWFPDGLAQRMTFVLLPGSDWAAPGGGCCPL